MAGPFDPDEIADGCAREAAGTSMAAPNFTVLALLSASVPKNPTKLWAHMTCGRPGNISKLTISRPLPAAMSARPFANTASSAVRCCAASRS
jgi:hypothetical protein